MTYFKDLTRCTYGGLRHRAAGELAVGWLSDAHRFPTGDFPRDLLARMATLAERPVNRFRGMHTCDICPPATEQEFDERPSDPHGVEMFRFKESPSGEVRKVWVVSDRTDWSVQIDGRHIDVGNGEIQVTGKGATIYVAPTMILHYIAEHHYLPPDEFIKALKVVRVPELPPEAFVY